MARAGLLLAVLLIALTQAGAAFGHASLVRSEPADGAVLPEPPATLRLTFNEPVTPLVTRLIAPGGATIAVSAVVANMTVTVPLPALQRGTHVLSWRVISADGHPVGGAVVFSVGVASGSPAAVTSGDPLVRTLLWAAKAVIYLALFVGVGGVFLCIWLASAQPRWLIRSLSGLMLAGLAATTLSVGLQGLDAMDLHLGHLAQPVGWRAGLATTYGLTVIMAIAAQLTALVALGAMLRSARPAAPRGLSFAAWAMTGLALALSGHASNAAPQALTRPAVLVHVLCAAFWIAALLPLIANLREGMRGPLLRFSQFVPYPLALLVVSGMVLAAVQLDRVDALWTTHYGVVLSCKIVAVIALLLLATLNRYRLAPLYQRGDGAPATRPLARSMAAELGIATIVLALVAAWRFTPPPRALAAAEPIEVHLHGAAAMAHLSLMPVRDRDPRVAIAVMDTAFNALTVKEVTVILASPAHGIEPVRRPATRSVDGHWQVEGLRIPAAGTWVVRVDLLINDFERLVLEDRLSLPRLP